MGGGGLPHTKNRAPAHARRPKGGRGVFMSPRSFVWLHPVLSTSALAPQPTTDDG